MTKEERIVTMIDNHIAEYYPQRKLIRCKDCIHFKYDADGYGDCMLDGGIVRTIYTNDYCSWAERKEE